MLKYLAMEVSRFGFSECKLFCDNWLLEDDRLTSQADDLLVVYIHLCACHRPSRISARLTEGSEDHHLRNPQILAASTVGK